MKYFQDLVNSISDLEIKKINKLAELLSTCSSSNGIIYVAGNGGSASISDHFVCDFNKANLNESPNNPFRAVSLNSSMSLLSALNNDFEERMAFAWQIEHFCSRQDIFLAISSSGNSVNLINAINSAKKKKMTTLSLTGMGGGKISTLTDFNITVNSNRYGVIEDTHMAILHSIRQEIL